MRAVAMLLTAVLLLPVPALAEEGVGLQVRPGVVQPVYFTPASSPVATVILFPGGNGAVASVRNNFLIRVANRFVAAGISAVIADAPSDSAGGMSTPFRQSAQHANDVAAIVAYARSRAAVPVWLVGTSRGSISAANAAARLGSQVAGVVLTSSVWEGGMNGVPLAQITVPVLVVHNRDDGCRESPFSDVQGAMATTRQARVKDLIVVSGGISRSDPCQAQSPHGYFGIEDQVVPAIIAWIKSH